MRGPRDLKNFAIIVDMAKMNKQSYYLKFMAVQFKRIYAYNALIAPHFSFTLIDGYKHK